MSLVLEANLTKDFSDSLRSSLLLNTQYLERKSNIILDRDSREQLIILKNDA
jgi:hypothetical protein